MDDIDKIFKKLETIGEDVTAIKINQAMQGKDIERNADDLEEHMRRTQLLEDALEPLANNHMMWVGVGKGMAILGVVISVVLGMIKIVGG